MKIQTVTFILLATICHLKAQDPPVCNYIRTTYCEQPALNDTCPMTCGEAGAGCKAIEGFFKMTSGCYKFFNDKQRYRHQAYMDCRDAGLQLARVYDADAVALRKYIVENYPSTEPGTQQQFAHVGARGGDDNVIKWDRDDEEVLADNPLWYIRQPGTHTNRDWCLALMTTETFMKDRPNRPYTTINCDDAPIYTLCEVFMKP